MCEVVEVASMLILLLLSIVPVGWSIGSIEWTIYYTMSTIMLMLCFGDIFLVYGL